MSSHDAFRQQIRDFLAKELTPDLVEAASQGFAISREAGSLWHRKLFEAGWIAPGWPKEYGGTGWSVTQKHIFSEELALAGAPMIMPFGIGMVGPVIYAFGNDAQKAEHLPPILDGSIWWCQGYSEPASGSDLASLQTRAVRDGDHYVVTGQKIWTTNAHKADWIFALVRTDPDVKPQAGISFLLIDMHSPGIEVKPIHSIDGYHHLNEVFFDAVRVPVANRIGDENMGWSYAKFLLGHERTGIAGVALSRRSISALRDAIGSQLAGTGGSLADDPDFSRRLDATEVRLDALAETEGRLLAAMEDGGSPGAESSMLKIIGTEIQQTLESLHLEAAGYYGLPMDMSLIQGESNDPPPGPEFALRAASNVMFGRAASIYGGSNEIQRNVMARAVLGL